MEIYLGELTGVRESLKSVKSSLRDSKPDKDTTSEGKSRPAEVSLTGLRARGPGNRPAALTLKTRLHKGHLDVPVKGPHLELLSPRTELL